MQWRAPTTSEIRSASSLIGGAVSAVIPSNPGHGSLVTGHSSLQRLICRQCQELCELLLLDETVQYLRRIRQPARSCGLELRDLFRLYRLVEIFRCRATVGKMRAVVDPLPELRASDLRGRDIFHQIED